MDPDKVCDDLLALSAEEFLDKYRNMPMANGSKPDRSGEALTAIIRGVITARPGWQLASADFASIEARIVLWLAKSPAIQMIKDFDNGIGQDIYIVMAEAIYDRKGLTKENKVERDLGKRAVLGCGFGMGADKFLATCLKYQVYIDFDLAQKAVTAYRSMFAEVPQLWRGLERAAITTMRTGRPSEYSLITYRRDGDFLLCQLPSGRDLRYYKPELKTGINKFGKEGTSLTYLTTDQQTKQIVRTDTYGGALTENVVQAMARDMMAPCVNKLHTLKDYHVILHTHDEVIGEGTPTFDWSIKSKILSEPPAWAADFPLRNELELMKRYRK
jgi:DNA polymerase